jgi:hypothetical protein
MKAIKISTGGYVLSNFETDKPSGAGAFLCHRLDNKGLSQKFNKDNFEKCLNDLWIETDKIYDFKQVKFYGYSPSMDLLMLRKYNIDIDIIDIRELLQLSPFEERLAKEGNNLETAYYIVTNKIPEIKNHGDLDELRLVAELFEWTKKLKLKNYLTVMPFGHCAGMPIIDYVISYRRQADGYRFNNTDALSDSMTYQIEYLEEETNSRFDDDEDNF